jgi:hypothetical protein
MDSVQKEYPSFQAQMAKLERDLLAKCALDWGSVSQPKAFGKLTPKAGEFGRTTILPGLFHDQNLVDLATWRQLFIAAGNQVLLQGNGAGNTLPEDFKVGCMGFAFPNKEQAITEIKMQIGDRKFGRINLEEMRGYNKPAVILEEGFTIDEEESFELYGYVEGPIPVAHDGFTGIYQRIVPIGFCAYKIIDKVLGNCGATII